MKTTVVCLVAGAGKPRKQIARYLRDARFEVFECEELSIAARFADIVLLDDGEDDGEGARLQVQSWFKTSKPPRVAVISSTPVKWKTLSLAFSDRLTVLAAPVFAWDLVDTLRPVTRDPPKRA